MYLYSRSASIYGGSAQIQRNVLAERYLGLPPTPTGVPWGRGGRVIPFAPVREDSIIRWNTQDHSIECRWSAARVRDRLESHGTCQPRNKDEASVTLTTRWSASTPSTRTGRTRASRDQWVAPRAEKVSEVVARSIVQDIASRSLQPGTMLPPETVMLERYRVGRASLARGSASSRSRASSR